MTTTKCSKTNKEKGVSTLDTTTNPLAIYTPDPSYAEEYVGRDINGIEDFKILEAAHKMRHNVLLSGPTGSAKTSLVYAYASKVGLPVINVPCSGGVDVRTLIGGWTPTADGSFAFSAGPLVKGVEHGAIIYLDEVNFMPPKISACLHGLLDKRRTISIPEAAGSDHPTEIKAHPNTFVIATMNPNYAGTRPLNEAFRNRFAIKLDWGYNTDVESELLASASLLEMATAIRVRAEAGEIAPIPTNILIEFEDICDTFGSEHGAEAGFEFAVNNLLNAYEDEIERRIVSDLFEIYKTRILNELGIDSSGFSDSEE